MSILLRGLVREGMVSLLNLGAGIGQLIVTAGGGFGRVGDIFLGIVLAGVRG